MGGSADGRIRCPLTGREVKWGRLTVLQGERDSAGGAYSRIPRATEALSEERATQRGARGEHRRTRESEIGRERKGKEQPSPLPDQESDTQRVMIGR